MKRALVCGAGGFIGGHLVKRLKSEGYWVRGVDIKYPEFSKSFANEFFILDLRSIQNCVKSLKLPNKEFFDEVYQLAADMGGAGYVFTGEHDYNIMHNSAQINLNFSFLYSLYKKIFYSSSACIYPESIQRDTKNPGLKESHAYPANPDSEYGWEKIFSERLYLNLHRNKGVEVRIARFHNIFGPEGTWRGGKEKAPAAISRKVAEVSNGGTIEIWGDGKQTRSFLYVDECLEGILRLMKSNLIGPVNIGSEEMISINDLAFMTAKFDHKKIKINHIPGPLGVRGRNSENSFIKEKMGWAPNYPLVKGMEKTYYWIKSQLNKFGGDMVFTRFSPEKIIEMYPEGIFHFMNMNDLWYFNNISDYKKILTNYQPNFFFPEGATIASYIRIPQQRAEDFTKRFLLSNHSKKKKHLFIGISEKELSRISLTFRLPRQNLAFIFVEEYGSELINTLLSKIKEFKPDYIWNCINKEYMAKVSSEIFDNAKIKYLFNIGISINYLIGKRKSAPNILRKVKAEWFYRLVTDFVSSKEKVLKSYLAKKYLNSSVTIRESDLNRGVY